MIKWNSNLLCAQRIEHAHNMHIFLGGKTCCAFDCTPNVDTAIEDKMKDRQKATLQATQGGQQRQALKGK